MHSTDTKGTTMNENTEQGALPHGSILNIEHADAFTYGSWTDRYPATIIRRTAHTITTQDDNAQVVSGSEHDGTAVYEYKRDGHGVLRMWRKNKNGKWQCRGYRGSEGARRAYRDPSF